jgi:hypothetical protein
MKSITIRNIQNGKLLIKVRRTKTGIEVICLDNMNISVMAVLEDNSRVTVKNPAGLGYSRRTIPAPPIFNSDEE